MNRYQILVLVKGFTFTNFEAILDALTKVWGEKYRIDGVISRQLIKQFTIAELESSKSKAKQIYVNRLVTTIWQGNKGYCEVEVELDDIKPPHHTTTWKTELTDYAELTKVARKGEKVCSMK